MYREEGVERASRGGVSSELMAYVGQALAGPSRDHVLVDGVTAAERPSVPC